MGGIMDFLTFFAEGICHVIWSVWKCLLSFGETCYNSLFSILENWDVIPISMLSSIDEGVSILNYINDCPALNMSNNPLVIKFFDLLRDIPCMMTTVLVVLGLACGIIEGIFDTFHVLQYLAYYGEVKARCVPMIRSLQNMQALSLQTKELFDKAAIKLTKAHVQEPFSFLSKQFEEFQYS